MPTACASNCPSPPASSRPNNPTASTPQIPPTAWTEMAPPGSSTSSRKSSSSTENVTSAPATRPTINDLGGRDERTGGAAGHKASHPAVGGERGIGFAEAKLGDYCRRQRRRRCAEQRIHGDQRHPAQFHPGEQHGPGGIQAQPSHERHHASEQNQHRVVAGNRHGHSFGSVLAPARAHDPGDRERRQSAQRVDRPGAAGIEIAASKPVIDAQVGPENRRPRSNARTEGRSGRRAARSMRRLRQAASGRRRCPSGMIPASPTATMPNQANRIQAANPEPGCSAASLRKTTVRRQSSPRVCRRL